LTQKADNMAVWTALSRWLGEAPAARPPEPSAAQPAGGGTPSATVSLDVDDVHPRFTAWVLAANALRPSPATRAERDIVARLKTLARAPGDQRLVPRMPALLPRLMSLVRRDDVSAREIAAQLARDPALVGEVVRVANSPRYGVARPITDLQDAVAMLGEAGLRQLLAAAVMGPVFNVREGRFSRAGAALLWRQAESCAHAAAELRRGQPDRFEAYLGGLVANVGLIAALRVLDLHYTAAAAPDTLGFHAALFDVNGRLSAAIARQWNFPGAVVEALEARACPRPGTDVNDLAVALCAADGISKRDLLGPGE